MQCHASTMCLSTSSGRKKRRVGSWSRRSIISSTHPPLNSSSFKLTKLFKFFEIPCVRFVKSHKILDQAMSLFRPVAKFVKFLVPGPMSKIQKQNTWTRSSLTTSPCAAFSSKKLLITQVSRKAPISSRKSRCP